MQSRSVRNIVCSKASPKSSFVRANDALSFAAPELLLAHEAARLSPIDAALIAYELCGTYTLDPRTNTMVYGLEPVTSVADIQGFLRDMRGKVPGRKRLLNALEHVQDNSWSPMESVLALILSMPSSKGGFGLNNIVLNQRASSAGSSCSRVPDIVLGHSKVGINYEGETHFGTRAITDAAMHAASTTSLEALGEIQAAGAGMRSSIVRDKQRDRDLLLAGYKVIPATKEDLRTQEALDNLVWQLLQLEYDELGIARPAKSEVAGTYAVRAKRRALLRQLMHR